MNYYVEYWESDDTDRNNEIISCINKNILSGFFDNIFVFSEKKQQKINADIIISERITYQKIFNFDNSGVNILANSDIQFDGTINLANKIKSNEFYGLTRYEKDGKLHKHDDPYMGYDSQDVWIWKDKCLIKNGDFYLGVPGCDNKIAFLAENFGYTVKNPSMSIKTYHCHDSNIRNGTSSNLKHRLSPPYKLIPIEYI